MSTNPHALEAEQILGASVTPFVDEEGFALLRVTWPQGERVYESEDLDLLLDQITGHSAPSPQNSDVLDWVAQNSNT